MTRLLTVANYKGGAGKTTTVVSLAGVFAEQKQRVLVVDLDIQGSTTTWLNQPLADETLLRAWQTKRINRYITQTDIPGISCIPAATNLDQLNDINALKHSINTIKDNYDWIIFDSPPRFETITVAGFIAAKDILIPLQISALDLNGLINIVEMIEKIRTDHGLDIRILGILPTHVNQRTTLAKSVLNHLKNNFSTLALTTVIHSNVRLREAPLTHQPITTYAPTSNGAHDYRNLANEITKRKTTKP